MSHSLDASAVETEASRSTEVTLSHKRRRYSLAFKLRIIAEADSCIRTGELTSLLRREGIYSSTLGDFRKQKARGDLEGKLKDRAMSAAADPSLVKELSAAEREVRRLNRELARARALLDLQKKVSELLGLSLEATEQA